MNVTSLCGNFAVEGEEECDGGFVGMFNDNSCCNTNCKLVEEADCRYVCTCTCSYMHVLIEIMCCRHLAMSEPLL